MNMKISLTFLYLLGLFSGFALATERRTKKEGKKGGKGKGGTKDGKGKGGKGKGGKKSAAPSYIPSGSPSDSPSVSPSGSPSVSPSGSFSVLPSLPSDLHSIDTGDSLVVDFGEIKRIGGLRK